MVARPNRRGAQRPSRQRERLPVQSKRNTTTEASTGHVLQMSLAALPKIYEPRLLVLPSRREVCSCGRCFRAVDSRLEGAPTLIAIDAEPHHPGVHTRCLRQADGPASQPRAPRAQGAGDLVRVGLPPRGRLGLHLARVGPPPVGDSAREAPRLPPRLACPKDGGLPSSTPLRAPLARGGRKGVATHGAPPAGGPGPFCAFFHTRGG